MCAEESYDRSADELIQRYVGENLGTPEQILEKLSRLEASGDYIKAYNLAYEACDYNVVDVAEKRDFYYQKIREIQKEMLDSKPFSEMVLAENGLFESVCCEKMKEFVIKDEVGAYCCDCMCGCMSLATSSPEIIKMVMEKDKDADPEDYEGYDYIDLDECPFCGKKVDL